MGRSTRQIINEEITGLICTLEQVDLVCVYTTFHSTAEEYIFFSSMHETPCKIDHMLNHKAILSKFKTNEVVTYTISDHSGMKLEINNLNSKKYTGTKKLNSIFSWMNGGMKIKRKIKLFLEMSINNKSCVKSYI